MGAALPRSCTFCLVLDRIGYAVVANQPWNLCGTANKQTKKPCTYCSHRDWWSLAETPLHPWLSHLVRTPSHQVFCYRGGEACKLTPAFRSIIPEITCVSTAPNPLGKISNIIEGWRAGNCLECMDIWWVLSLPPFLYQATEAKLRSSQWVRTGNKRIIGIRESGVTSKNIKTWESE